MGRVGQHANKGVCEVPCLAAKQRTGDKIPSLSVSQGGQRTGVCVWGRGDGGRVQING